MTFLSEAPIPATSLARSSDTVTLGSNVPKIIAWALAVSVGVVVVRKLMPPAPTYVPRPDAIDELARESRRIQRRVAKRRAMKAA